jgi:hypothetical protein
MKHRQPILVVASFSAITFSHIKTLFPPKNQAENSLSIFSLVGCGVEHLGMFRGATELELGVLNARSGKATVEFYMLDHYCPVEVN